VSAGEIRQEKGGNHPTTNNKRKEVPHDESERVNQKFTTGLQGNQGDGFKLNRVWRIHGEGSFRGPMRGPRMKSPEADLRRLKKELMLINRSADSSLEEGLEETLPFIYKGFSHS